jgi:hypothetical protein
MPKKLLKPVAVFGLVVIVALLGARILLPKPPEPPPLPQPNGYDDFAKAGQMLSGEPRPYRQLTLAELQQLVSSNATAMQLVRQGLTKECRLPLKYSLDYVSNRVEEVMSFRGISDTMLAEGRLAVLENRPEDAAWVFVEAIHFGCEISRGGVALDRLLGSACEIAAGEELKRVIPVLQAGSSHHVLSNLEAIIASKEPLDEVVRREALWSRRAHGWRGWIDRFSEAVTTRSPRPLTGQVDLWGGMVHSRELELRRVMITVAAHAYELEKGQPPKTVADLVPAYLKAIPKDPVTGANLVYTP